jgi:4-alpha-glucanotransferase
MGIVAAYRPMRAAKAIATTDATRERLLAAMGHDTSTESRARQVLQALDARDAERLLAPARILFGDEAAARTLPVRTRLARGCAVGWRIEVHSAESSPRVRSGRSRADSAGRLRLPLPRLPALGDFDVRLTLDAAGELHEARQRLALCPRRCFEVAEACSTQPGLGVLVNLFALRSRDDWGVGDLGALARVASLAPRWGCDFLGSSPLHATRNRGVDVSPYSPISRLFRNECYLDVEAVPELRECAAARRRIEAPAFRARLAKLRDRDRVDWDGVYRAKHSVLRELHRHFATRHREARTPRGRAYARFLVAAGEPLRDFGTYLAIAAQQERAGRGSDWRRWPTALRRPDTPEVKRFREHHVEAVDYHCWLQFELDRQLARASRRAERAGLALGLYGDLAVGSDPGGFDAWAAPELHASGARIGAPPDDFAADGQDWGFPALIPDALAERGFHDWTRLLRANMESLGMLRLDHAMGLERLWWIPAGRPASEGAYVRYPARELIALLSLESRRRKVVVIGEDLGTVARGFASRLARRGILSMRVLPFEREGRGFRRPKAVSNRSLVLSTSHDLVPLAGYLVGRDLERRGAAAALPEPERAHRARQTDAAALRRRLGLPSGPLDPGRIAHAALRWLRATPAPLVGMPLEDLLEARDPVNLPGVPQDRHASWTQRLATPVEKLDSQAVFRSLRRERAGSTATAGPKSAPR